MRLTLTFPHGSRRVPGSEAYVILHPSSLLHYDYKSLRVSLYWEKKKKKRLACIEFLCLAYKDQCQNCRLFNLIVCLSYLCRSLHNCVSHRYWSKRARLSRSLAMHEISFLITALKIRSVFGQILCVFRIFLLLHGRVLLWNCHLTLQRDSLVFSEENCQDTFIDYNNAYRSISQRIHVVLFICVIIHGLTRNNSGLIMQTAVHNMQMNINKTKHKPPE